ALPFAITGRLDIFLWTQFVFPTAAIGAAELAPPSKLLISGGYLFTTVALFLPAAVVGTLRLGRSSLPFSRYIGYFSVAWVVVGLAAIVAQRFSWHAYHFVMLFWPIGILAAAGVAVPFERSTDRRSNRRSMPDRVVIALLTAGVLVNGARFAWHQVHPFMPVVDSNTYLGELSE